MGLSQDFFDNPHPNFEDFGLTKPFPDLNATWQRVTWSRDDFELDWSRYEGKSNINNVNAFSLFYFILPQQGLMPVPVL